MGQGTTASQGAAASQRTTARRRKYSSPLREAQAGQTRVAILAAASQLFAEHGWAGTAMRGVARAAGVSVETVYTNFGSKSELLKQALDVAVVGDDEPVPLNERPIFRALAEGDLTARARAAGHLLATMHHRTAPLRRCMQQAAPSDPDLAEVLRRGMADERESVRQGVTAVAQRAVTKAEVDAMFALLSTDVFLLLTEISGWTEEAYESWVATTVVRQLELKGE